MATASPGDFIERELYELDAQKRSRSHITRVHWLSFLLLALLLGVLAVALAGNAKQDTHQAKHIEALTQIDIRLARIEAQVAARGELVTESWTSRSFVQGREQQLEEDREKKLQWSGQGACSQGRVLWPASSGGPSPVEVINDQSAGPLVVLIVGGHDRTPLGEDAQLKFGTNAQLAQARAHTVQKYLENCVDPLRRGSVRFLSLARAASNFETVVSGDRAVTVTVLRMQRS